MGSSQYYVRVWAKEWQQRLLGQHRFVILILHSFLFWALALFLPFMLVSLFETGQWRLLYRHRFQTLFLALWVAFQHSIHNKIYLFDKWPYEGDYFCLFHFFLLAKEHLRAVRSCLPQNHLMFRFDTYQRRDVGVSTKTTCSGGLLLFEVIFLQVTHMQHKTCVCVWNQCVVDHFVMHRKDLFHPCGILFVWYIEMLYATHQLYSAVLALPKIAIVIYAKIVRLKSPIDPPEMN